MGKKNQVDQSRREFLKGSLVAGGAGIALGVAGCAPKVEGTPVAQPGGAEGGAVTGEAASSCATVPGYSGAVDWLGSAPIVADADITETIETEVLVIGAGHAGVMAALGAVENGAKVVVIEKKDEAGFFTDYWHRVGEDIGHVNSNWLINRGYGPYDTGEIVEEFVKRSGGRVDPRLIRLYVENSGEMFDHMIEIYESYEELRKERFSAVEFEYFGDNARVETIDFSNMLSEEMLFNQTQMGLKGTDYPIELNGYKTWPINAMFQGPVLHEPVMPFVSALRFFQTFIDQKTKDLGAEWYYEHSAVVLTQDANGAVTGVIAQDKDGKYKKFVASKGTLVSTGDFGANADMCWALINDQMEWAERGGKKIGELRGMYQDGAGHKMCVWAGGHLEPLPRPTMGMASAAGGPWGMTPMLQLNANAKRYANEAAIVWLGHIALRQPKGLLTSVTDSNYMETVKIAGLDHGGPNFGRGDLWYNDFQEDMAKVMDAGAEGYPVRGITVAERNPSVVFGANTLEELAGYLGYTGDQVQTFVEEINRYNEFCANGVDPDFGKDPKALIPVANAPFYGVKGENSGTMNIGLVTLAGLMTDDKFRVLNSENQPIEGLYVAGNTLGGRYGMAYVTPYAGNSVGMALTHGWLVGKNLAAA